MTATDGLIERLLPLLSKHTRITANRPFYTACLCGWSGPATNYPRHEARAIAEFIQTETYDDAKSAVLHGAVQNGSQVEGMTKDSALEFAASFFHELEGDTDVSFRGPEMTHVWVDEVNDFDQRKADD